MLYVLPTVKLYAVRNVMEWSTVEDGYVTSEDVAASMVMTSVAPS